MVRPVTLSVVDALPAGFLRAPAADLYQILSGPTLIHLPGRQERPLFVSILLHGNEDVGLRAIQEVLAQNPPDRLPRALSIFVGNVRAAKENQRRLDDQPDYNRVWQPVGEHTAEHDLMARVVEEMRLRDVFASIDLHNNTGHNPHYACVTELEHRHLHLASLFSRTAVFFEQPAGVQTMAFAPLCPAVTCECGKVGDELGVERAAAFVDACLHLAEHPEGAVPQGDLHLFHTVATAKVVAGTAMSFDASEASLRFPVDFEWMNFREIAPGHEFARLGEGGASKLRMSDEAGKDVTDEFLEFREDRVLLKRLVMPAMLTSNVRVIEQDCLGYFMERMQLPE